MNGLKKTRQVLAQTRNRAVLPLLSAGLRSSLPEVRAAAIRAAIQRVDLPSHHVLLREFRAFGDAERTVVAEAHRRMPHHAAPALKAAFSAGDAMLRDNACEFILVTRDFDSFALMLEVCAQARPDVVRPIAATILALANLLHDHAAHWSDPGDRAEPDPSFVRHRALAALERFLSEASREVPREILEAFLLLAPTEHPTLLDILDHPQDHSHAQLVAILSTSDNASIFDRLVAMLRDSDAPQAALAVIARRDDRPFVEYLLQAVRHPVPLRVIHNMKRLRSIAWLETHRTMLLDFDGRAQALAVELAVASDIPREALFDLLVPILREGLAEGRRVACDALVKFDEPQADMLVLAALEDPDGGVQAAAARQLRPRRLPDALRVLVEFLDAPSAEVREAARSSLAEFNFVRYRAMFGLLDEHALQTTGALVHKVDHSAIDGLLDELTSPSISARLRGIEMAVAMQATQDVCGQLIELAKHENVAVRKEALSALAHCSGPSVVAALQLAASDANHTIADTARLGLEKLSEPADPPRRDNPGGAPASHSACFLPCLLAFRDVWGRFDHQRPSGDLNQLLLFAGMAAVLAAALLVVLRVARRSERRFTSNSQSRLFGELCRAHGLTRFDRRLLKRLATGRRLVDPTLVFVEPLHFDPNSLPVALHAAAGPLQKLRAQLFS